MTYDSFVSGLKNLEGDKQEINRLEEKKDELEYLESGVKGLDPQKIHVSGNPSVVAQVRLAKVDEIEQINEEIELIKANVKNVLRVFNKQDNDVRDILAEIYFVGCKKVDVAKKFEFKTDVEMDRYLRKSYIQ